MSTKNGTFVFRLLSVLMLLSLLVSVLGVTPANAAWIRYAKPAASGTGDCLSWANACTLQTALTGTVGGAEIWVAAGTHKPTTGADRTATFQLKSGVSLYGGFAGTETARNQRLTTYNSTILSGDLLGDDNSNVNYDEPTRADNSYHVVTGASGVTLDGFTITAGNANDGSVCPGGCGGGMDNTSGSSPMLTNLTFSGNSASFGGGGLNNDSSSPTLTNVTFSGNSSGSFGGGMYNKDSSSPALTNVTFSGNSAGGGGGMNNIGSSNPTLTNVTFSGNSATDGGGMRNINSSSPQIRNTIFWGNTATNGAQIFNTDGTSVPSISNSVVQGGCPAGSTCTGALITADPLLGTLGNYGGFTQTIPLEAGSSAIDGTSSNCPIQDQHGVDRSFPTCDIGAYEFNGGGNVGFFAVRPLNDQIDAQGWPLGNTLTVSIDDPGIVGSVDYTATETVSEFNTNFTLDGFDLQSGQIVTMTDGITTKTHTVSGLSITDIDFDTDTITGTAESGSTVFVSAKYGVYQWNPISVTALAGIWTAHFSGVGEGDIQRGSRVWVYVADSDSDDTRIFWRLPEPWLAADFPIGFVDGFGWPLGSTVTVSIDDPDIGDPDYAPHSETVSGYIVNFDLADQPGFKLQPGQTITMSGLIYGQIVTKVLTVSSLSITGIDVDTDTITGTVEGDSVVLVEVNNGQATQEVAAIAGLWTADFSGVAGGDIQIGSNVWTQVGDSDDDGTNMSRTVGGAISGTVYLINAAPGNVLAGVMIEACSTPGNYCRTTMTDESGKYMIDGLQAGTYNLRAIPPGSNLPGHLGPITISSINETLSGRDVIVAEPPVLPPPNAVVPAHTGGGTIAVYWMDNLTLTTHGCVNGTAAFELAVLDDGYTINGAMTEAPAGSGTYKATIPPLHPHSGVTEIVYTVSCAGGTTVETPFFIYIDPSGVVKDTSGAPISNATITLFYADNPDGPFSEVPDDSTMMSPSNRDNPDTTNANGQFGWDVVAGFYKVRAEKAGCFSPTDPTQAFVESTVLTVPPPATGLELILQCSLPPSASAGGPYTVEWGATLMLDGSGSTDPDNNITLYEWDLDNDGEYDDASGVTPAASFTQIGNHPIGLRVTDDGGLSDTDTATVMVLPWTLKGFYQPVDMNGVYNLVKGGSTVPLKFEIFAGTIELTDIASVKSLTYAQTSCDANATTDEIETTATGGTSLRYADGQFIYNWKTPKTAGKCYRVTMTTMDGSSLLAYFKLK